MPIIASFNNLNQTNHIIFDNSENKIHISNNTNSNLNLEEKKENINELPKITKATNSNILGIKDEPIPTKKNKF